MNSFKKNLLLLFIVCFFMFSITAYATEDTQIVSDMQEENIKPFDELPAVLRDYKNEDVKAVNIREAPSTSSKILITLPVGEQLTVLDQTGKWIEVRYNDISGFVFWKYIGFIEPEIVENSNLVGNSIIHSTSSKNRDTNIFIACNTINGILLQPGEEFRWSEIIGQTTAEKGYLMSISIIGGQYTDDRGGGVCQVSTTIYNALLNTSIKPTSLHHHSAKDGVAYVDKGYDATVAHGSKDFAFKNTYDFPIYIESYSYKGIVFVNLYKVEEVSKTE